MRISDWSSDVCSADLDIAKAGGTRPGDFFRTEGGDRDRDVDRILFAFASRDDDVAARRRPGFVAGTLRIGGPGGGSPQPDRASVVQGQRGSEREDLGGRRTLNTTKAIP